MAGSGGEPFDLDVDWGAEAPAVGVVGGHGISGGGLVYGASSLSGMGVGLLACRVLESGEVGCGFPVVASDDGISELDRNGQVLVRGIDIIVYSVH